MKSVEEGGCRCGAARYEVNLEGAQTLTCHCLDCRKHLGAPFSVFTVVKTTQFKWLQAPTGKISISKQARRLFCNKCGTYLKWEGLESAHEAEFNTMTLDDASDVTVDVEIFVRSRLPWVQPVPNVPQFPKGRI